MHSHWPTECCQTAAPSGTKLGSCIHIDPRSVVKRLGLVGPDLAHAFTGRPAFLYFRIFLSVPIIFLYFDEIPIFSYIIFTPKKCCDARMSRHSSYAKMFIVNIKNWYVLVLLTAQQLVSKQPFIVCLVHGASVFRLVDGTLSDEGWGPRDDKIIQFASHYFLYFPIFHLKYSYIFPIFCHSEFLYSYFFVKKVTGRPAFTLTHGVLSNGWA